MDSLATTAGGGSASAAGAGGDGTGDGGRGLMILVRIEPPGRDDDPATRIARQPDQQLNAGFNHLPQRAVAKAKQVKIVQRQAEVGGGNTHLGCPDLD